MATTHENPDPTTLYPTTSTKSLLDKDYQVSPPNPTLLSTLIPPLEKHRNRQILVSQVPRFPTLDPHPPRLLHYDIRPKRDRLGRHALPPNVQRSPSNVLPRLQQCELITPHLDRNRLADPECSFLRNRSWAGPVAPERSLLLNPLAAGLVRGTPDERA